MKQVSKLDKAKACIVLDHPFFASILLRRPLIKTDSVPTLAVDAKGRIYYNEKFVESLTVPQIVWGLCHEVGHVTARHSVRQQTGAAATGVGATVIGTVGNAAKGELARAAGVDHVIEVGGPGTVPQSIEAVKVGGHISLIGVLTGGSGEIPTGIMMRKQARLHGFIVGNRTQQQDYVRALEATQIRPVIDSTFALDRIADAFRHEESGRHFGKICLAW